MRQEWLKLADIFDRLLGGTAVSQQAARYLRGLARGELPENSLTPLAWHEDAEMEVMPLARPDPHPCVVAVLCPSIPLRAVWRRQR